MGKKNRNRPAGGNAGRYTPPVRTQASQDEVNAAIKDAKQTSDAVDAALDAAAEAGLDEPRFDSRVDQPPAGQSFQDACLKAYRVHLELAETYRDAKAALDAQRAELTEEKERLGELQASIEPRKAEVAREQERVEQLAATIEGRIQGLDHREVELAQRETDLAAGRLAAAFAMYVAPLEQRRNELFARFSGEIAAAQDQARKDLAAIRAEALAQNAEGVRDLENQRSALSVQQQELDSARVALEEERQRLERMEANLEEQRENLLDDVRAERDEARRWLDMERQAFNETTSQRDRDIQRIARKAALVEVWENELGDVEGVNAQLETLRSDADRLRQELARRSTLVDEVDLQVIRRERNDFSERVDQLTAELQRMDKERAGLRTELIVAEADRDAARSLIATVDAYKETVAQLRHDLENLSKTGESKTPFRECAHMDQDSGLQQRRPLVDDERLDLTEFIDTVQWSLYHDPSRRLSYRKRDLRLFVAGLAMSRLHILEGVSGTGKTTLPIAFAEHIGGGSANVAVQAGWRDRQDLLGYFNEFQGHFRESDFLRGVYRAMTPACADGAFFVVLDEMNLSKVEQYFADYLKALEDAEGADLSTAGAVPLMDRSDIVRPARLEVGKSGGLVLPLPPNLWFIGTANQDETTQSFAPKTQSRAHIMELPHVKPTVEEMESELASARRRGFGGDTVPWSLLRDAFTTAQGKPEFVSATHIATKAFEAVNDAVVELDPSLALAPRFYRQLEAFVPVFLACGGALASAADHLVCSKVVRRMNERYNIQQSDRAKFNEALRTIWVDYNLGDYSGTTAKALLSGRVDR